MQTSTSVAGKRSLLQFALFYKKERKKQTNKLELSGEVQPPKMAEHTTTTCTISPSSQAMTSPAD